MAYSLPYLWSLEMKSWAVKGKENMPYVPSVAICWPSAEVVAVQSVSVTTLNPFSQAVRMVDSTQQFVRNPASAKVSIPCALSCSSKSVSGKASRPFFPVITTSEAWGAMASHIVAFHEPAMKRLSLAHPARIPWPLLGLSDMSWAKEIGAWKILAPLNLAEFATATELVSIRFESMTALTAGNNLPPS